MVLNASHIRCPESVLLIIWQAKQDLQEHTSLSSSQCRSSIKGTKAITVSCPCLKMIERSPNNLFLPEFPGARIPPFTWPRCLKAGGWTLAGNYSDSLGLGKVSLGVGRLPGPSLRLLAIALRWEINIFTIFLTHSINATWPDCNNHPGQESSSQTDLTPQIILTTLSGHIHWK